MVLERLQDKLRDLGFMPMVFNFDKPETKDFSETVRLLCNLSKFVIVDITNPRSAPLELQATVPDYMVPFVPILQQGEQPFAMFVDLQNKHDRVLQPVVGYPSVDRLIEVLEDKVVRPAEASTNSWRGEPTNFASRTSEPLKGDDQHHQRENRDRHGHRAGDGDADGGPAASVESRPGRHGSSPDRSGATTPAPPRRSEDQTRDEDGEADVQFSTPRRPKSVLVGPARGVRFSGSSHAPAVCGATVGWRPCQMRRHRPK
jgi:hypothetical protein